MTLLLNVLCGGSATTELIMLFVTAVSQHQLQKDGCVVRWSLENTLFSRDGVSFSQALLFWCEHSVEGAVASVTECVQCLCAHKHNVDG